MVRRDSANLIDDAYTSFACVIDFVIQTLRPISFTIRPTLTQDSTFAPCMDIHGSTLQAYSNASNNFTGGRTVDEHRGLGVNVRAGVIHRAAFSAPRGRRKNLSAFCYGYSGRGNQSRGC